MSIFKKKTKEVKKEPVKKETRPASAPSERRPSAEKRTDLAWRILKNAHITEKATDLEEANKYIFNVYPQRNKNEIKKAVENIYGVEVTSVNVVNIPAKKRRLGRSQGWKQGYKKAIVSVAAGQKIEIMPR